MLIIVLCLVVLKACVPKLYVELYSCCPVWQLVVVHLLRYVNIVIKRLLLTATRRRSQTQVTARACRRRLSSDGRRRLRNGGSRLVRERRLVTPLTAWRRRPIHRPLCVPTSPLIRHTSHTTCSLFVYVYQPEVVTSKLALTNIHYQTNPAEVCCFWAG